MSDAAIVAIVTGVPTTIAAIVAAIIALVGLRKTKEAVKIADTTAAKADALIESTGKIHELTNSANSALVRELGIAAEKIAGLEKLMTQMAESKREAADVKVATDLKVALLTPAPTLATILPTPDATLAQIETNTSATAKNTQKAQP